MTCYEHADNCCVAWCKGCKDGARIDPLRDAVIEAAKRYRVELAGGYDGEAASAHKKLLLAVEALLATEEEE